MVGPQAGETRRCPGEKYDIALAICHARQAHDYAKCLLCPHRTGGAPDETASDPKVKSRIFRTTSVAGRVPSELNEYVMRKVGSAAAQCLRAESNEVSTMVVASDARENSRGLLRAFCEGVNAGGMHTVTIGPTMPEVLRFALVARKMGSAAFISGCHAAEDVNGVRIFRRGGAPVTFADGLDKMGLIARRVRAGRSRTPGQNKTLNPLLDYRTHVLKAAPQFESMKVVVDASGGMAGEVLWQVFARLPVALVRSNCEPDGHSSLLGERFPAASVQAVLAEAVRSQGARLGMAVDYDGDMCAFWDETGAAVRSDVVAALVAAEALARAPGARVAYDLRFTGAVREDILHAGGQPMRCAGDPLLLAQLACRNEVAYAADMMGRHFYSDLFGAESPVLTLLHLCSLLSRRGEPLSRIAAEVSRYSYSGELRYDFPAAEQAEQAAESVGAEFSEADHDTLDGLTCRFSDWWFNLRQTPGAPSLKLVVEGRSRNEERHGRQALERIIREHQGKAAAT